MRVLLLSFLLLTGCTSVVPVTQPWPEAPGLQSQQPCPPLQQLGPQPSLSDVAKTVANNYSEHYSCVLKLEAWQEWYQKQKLIHERLK